MALISQASIPTASAKRYLGQLCKHFEHRRPVTFDERHGRIEFDAGVCEVEADGGTLVLRAHAADAESLARVEDVVARHLVRFAFREELAMAWSPVMAPSG